MTTSVPASETVCAICMAPLGDGEPVETCPACHAPYHGSCWSENRGCAIYGCKMVPATEGLKPLEIPPAFWGREDKECPKCGKTIMALAVRCRHCGTMVEARPEDKASFERRQVRAASAPALRKWSVALLIGSLAPGIALIAAIAAMSTLKRRRADLAKLPATYGGLLRIAIAVGFTQSAILLLGWTAYWIKATLEL